MENKEISYEQYKEAASYIESFFKFAGLRFPYDMPEGDIPKNWPDDVKSAIETTRAFDAQLEKEGIRI